MSCEISSRRRDANLVLTISAAPTRNTLTPQACAAAIEALASAEIDTELSCVVLCGAGADFCAGMTGAREHLASLIETMRALDKPVIAAVEGDAMGAGCALVLGCDLVVASTQARFSLAGADMAWGAWSVGLPRALALQLMWLPDPMTALEWQAHGLVNRVVEPGQALDLALGVGEQLASLAPQVIAAAKRRMSD